MLDFNCVDWRLRLVGCLPLGGKNCLLSKEVRQSQTKDKQLCRHHGNSRAFRSLITKRCRWVTAAKWALAESDAALLVIA
jgi:hypothetical protein